MNRLWPDIVYSAGTSSFSRPDSRILLNTLREDIPIPNPSATLETRPQRGPHLTSLDGGAEGGARQRRRAALAAARRCLFSQQHAEGYWCGELEGDTILESEYILCLCFLGRAHEERAGKAAEHLRRCQQPHGGWSLYPGGPADLSSTVKAYLVLKLSGDEPDAPHMLRARRKILASGGLDACNSFTKLYLSIFGQYEWSKAPAVPPEMMFFPRWLYFNIYAMSSWSRAIVVPLSIIWAMKPHCPLPEHAQLDELRQPAGSQPPSPVPRQDEDRFWGAFFRVVDVSLKLVEAAGLKPLRRRALRRAEAWILTRLENSDGLGAIFPPIVNTLIALSALGYPKDHPVIRQQMQELENLEIDDGDTLRVQPCLSPVWDTALALGALFHAGAEGDDPRVLAAARWLLEKEVREPGDMQVIDPGMPVGGWYFEHANEHYPDCDDTAEVLKVLGQVRFPDPRDEQRRSTAIERGRVWLAAMQNRDGGWAAFDRGCDREILTRIPFADHNAMIDPSTVDITSRCIGVLRQLGVETTAPTLRRALAFLRREQESDGSWYGRWGCNYIYGTWLALGGLRAAGEPSGSDSVQRARAWLESCQNDDGGWGELPHSYDDPSTKGEGPSTAAQTAWALMGLLAAGEATSSCVRRGIEYLTATQRADGGWVDEHWTGTGFPKVFYLHYHLYATYFPLQALAMAAESLGWERSEPSGQHWHEGNGKPAHAGNGRPQPQGILV